VVLDLSALSFEHGLHSEVLGFGALNVPDNPLDAGLIHSLPTAFPRRYWYAPKLQAWLAANLRQYDGVVLHGMWLYPHWATARACSSAGVFVRLFPTRDAGAMAGVWAGCLEESEENSLLGVARKRNIPPCGGNTLHYKARAGLGR